MINLEWLTVLGFGLMVLFLYLIHRELVALRMDFRQVADLFASRPHSSQNDRP